MRGNVTDSDQSQNIVIIINEIVRSHFHVNCGARYLPLTESACNLHVCQMSGTEGVTDTSVTDTCFTLFV